MAKITRKTALIFGSNAGINQISEFGSLAASAPAYSIDPATIQSLSNWLEGWFAAVIGANSPAIEDMNAFCYVMAYQIAYLMQEGIPEWDSATTYYTGSLANDGTGKIYSSLQDTNLNHALTNTTWWKPIVGATNLIDTTAGSAITLTGSDSGKVYIVDTTSATQQFNFPAPGSNQGFLITIVDKAGTFGTNAVTMHRNGSEKIENLTADYACEANFGSWTFACNATDWYIIRR